MKLKLRSLTNRLAIAPSPVPINHHHETYLDKGRRRPVQVLLEALDLLFKRGQVHVVEQRRGAGASLEVERAPDL
jgi:hypothetical protein